MVLHLQGVGRGALCSATPGVRCGEQPWLTVLSWSRDCPVTILGPVRFGPTVSPLVSTDGSVSGGKLIKENEPNRTERCDEKSVECPAAVPGSAEGSRVRSGLAGSPGRWQGSLPPAVCSLLTCSGTSPEDPLPAGGGEDEDEEGAAELPEAMAPEVPQEPRSPQQVGPLLRPAELKPSARQASPRSRGPCSPVWAPSRQP